MISECTRIVVDLSDILIFFGASIIPIISVPVLFFVVYSYRIHVEEMMLVDIFGEKYTSYKKRQSG